MSEYFGLKVFAGGCSGNNNEHMVQIGKEINAALLELQQAREEIKNLQRTDNIRIAQFRELDKTATNRLIKADAFKATIERVRNVHEELALSNLVGTVIELETDSAFKIWQKYEIALQEQGEISNEETGCNWQSLIQ